METGNLAFVRCSACGYPQPGTSYNKAGHAPCPHCWAALHIDIFPALYRDISAEAAPGRDASDGTASCFYHPEKEAAFVCDTCGRYLCTLCDIDLGPEHICPVCMDRAARREDSPDLAQTRTLYDNIALGLAVYPLIMWPFTFVTAPVSVYMCIRHWRKPLSILPRTRIRFVAALIIAGFQITAWTAVLAGFLL